MFRAAELQKVVKGNLAAYVNHIGVHEARNPLVFAHNSGILVVSAVTVAPAARLAEFDALLTSVTEHVVQPDFPWTGSRLSVWLLHTPRPAESNRLQAWKSHLF